MKHTVLSTAAAAAFALFGASTVEAGPRHGGSAGGGGAHSGRGYVASSHGGHHHGHHNHGAHHHHGHHGHHGYHAPVYKVNTVEVNRYTQCRTAYDHRGRPYTYHVTVVTYCDHYSNGTSRTWSQTFS